MHLIPGGKKGNKEPFEHIFELYYRDLRYFAGKLTGNWEEGEDIVMDVFRKCWMTRDNFGTLANVKAFLYISVRNISLNYLRNRQRQLKYQQQYAEYALQKSLHSTNIEHELIRSEVLQALHHEIDGLPDRCREIFLLTVIRKIPLKIVADMLGISEHTVRNQKVRGLELLCQAFAKKEWKLLTITWFMVKIACPKLRGTEMIAC